MKSIMNYGFFRNITAYSWIASQARNDERLVPSLRGGTTKQSGLTGTWIASQARNDDTEVLSLT
jgi:hypothetical protein